MSSLAILHAADIAGSKDHPLVSRYAGSEIRTYEAKAYDESVIVLSPAGRKGFASTKRVEGKTVRLLYLAPNGRSTLEVFRNYELALKQAGFATLYSCADVSCVTNKYYKMNFTEHLFDNKPPYALNNDDQRYLAAKLSRPTGDVYVSLFVFADTNWWATHYEKGRVLARLDVIETTGMESGMVTVDAQSMMRDLSSTGHVSLYGIYFDTNKTEVKPESNAALEEIAKLMKLKPALRLLVVGHTDNAGGFEFNNDLSLRRAQAVVQTLVTKHGCTAARLRPVGVGMAAPVASNQAEQGRAKNRRVELVEY